ncbi:U-box domain containing protein [Beauveria brongniartii RCEF 3172]|uniref:U-box domain containing protein n=1 Tax=Beauveria brongniartii RCEF 3172 TaxID=1081107 RepID=A0A166XJC6_9HYPO|nr:U-box domain containing protein [Beauveria brongniartii RCEF 3172]
MDVPVEDYPVPKKSTTMKLSLHPILQYGVVVAKMQPPPAPRDVRQVGCSIVLVIDVSSSMDDYALKDSAEISTTSSQLTILNLIKHCALAIVKTMDDQDSLGIVIFYEKALTLYPIKKMSLQNKNAAERTLRNLTTQRGSNVWAGIDMALDMFEEADITDQVPAILLLSDGVTTRA